MTTRVSEVMTREYDCSSAEISLSASKVESGHQSLPPSSTTLAKSLTQRTIPSSPQHHRFNSVATTTASSTSSLQRSQSTDRPTSSPSSLQTSTSLGPPRGSCFSNQPTSSGKDARSPVSRRAPASRSSHGIATADGPPPALITQHSYHGDQWRSPPKSGQPHPPLVIHQQSQSTSTDTLTQTTKNKSQRDSEASSTQVKANDLLTRTGGMTAAPSSTDSHPELEEEKDTLRTLTGIPRTKSTITDPRSKPITSSREEDHSISSHEDLFLNLARADSEIAGAAEPARRSERRRVCHASFRVTVNASKLTFKQSQVSISGSQQTPRPRPSSSGQLASNGRATDEQPEAILPRWSQGYNDSPINKRHSSPRDRIYAASAHPLDQRRRYLHSEASSRASFATARTRNGSTPDPSPEQPNSFGRRQSVTESLSGLPSRGQRPSNRPYLSNGQLGSSPFASHSPIVDRDQARHPARIDGTESTISTTAPSTVWDELDDLKSRIRKLELTGKLPASSGAAISGAVGERPPTATTTITTASISPKHGQAKNNPTEASTIRESATAHPLLHSALANAKTIVDPKMYRILDEAASNALALVTMTRDSIDQSASTGSVVNLANPLAIDRQLRRKADSMCRSLTELCILLSEDKSNLDSKPHSRPQSRDTTTLGQKSEPAQEDIYNPHTFRASSLEPERSSSRIMSRLEARRASLLANSRESSQEPQTLPVQAPPSSASPAGAIGSDRASSSVARRRTGGPLDFENRPSSRATATEILSQRPSPQGRYSREYTSKHPLPNSLSTPTNNHVSTHLQHSQSVHSTLPARRNYRASASNSPATPEGIVNVQPRRYLGERATPALAEKTDEERLAEARQARVTSMGQHSSRRLRLVEGEGEG
ncbi:MAG: hypothetical protein LQ342_001206 [Letrouitia transgressa]|nr:MAG: hypothetical protein LQ342_001206 [Letrouitia transgressa]